MTARPARGGRLPAVLAIVPRLIPSTLIGVIKPLGALHRDGRIRFDVALETWVSRRQVARADVLVFCRNTEPAYAWPLHAAVAVGTPVIYELDDDFFSMPAGAPGGAYHRDPQRLDQLERYLRQATLVRVYSEALRARVTAYNARVHRVEGPLDWDLVPVEPPPRNPKVRRIVYATSRLEDTLAATFTADLRRILDAFRGRVEAWFLGCRPGQLAGHPDVHFREFVPDYDVFFRRFSRAGFDIGLAPLPDDEFHRAKSDNKFREYAASRIAGIYSDVRVYRESVADGRTGLLVPAAPDAWFSAMARLIEDDELRTRVQNEAWTCARARYGMAQSKATWLAHLEATLASDRAVAQPSLAAAAPSGTRRTLRFLRRGIEVLREGAELGPRITGLFRSTRALVQLRRELAKARRKRGHGTRFRSEKEYAE
ncbi:MAG TPA: hypothetical protein VMS64_37185 [Candidatus Methylomirabilis sp.]|nr:hypothetical protein [Candidatus Methylomirabilis sp.]